MRNNDLQVGLHRKWFVVEYFMIVSRMHGLTLTVRGANKNPGARVVPWTKTQRDDSQWWYEDYQPGTIRSALNGFCLEAQGNLHRTQDKQVACSSSEKRAKPL